MNETAIETWLNQRWKEERLTGLNQHVKYVHTKYMMIDPLGTDPMLITGSANFSDNSTRNNDENMVIIRGNRRVVDMYLCEFMRLFNHFRIRGTRLGASANRREGEAPTLFLSPDDSWAASSFEEGHPKQKERLLFGGGDERRFPLPVRCAVRRAETAYKTSKEVASMSSEISQGPWTRVRPLQRDEIDPYTEAGMMAGEITWGRFPNNLAKVMAYTPRLLQTEVEYCNTFIFDGPTFRGDVQEAGFNDRFIKELVISRTSLLNRSRYSVTHHSMIGFVLYSGAEREDEAHMKYLHLHEHGLHPEVYTEREQVVLDYTVKVATDAHFVTDEDFETLRRVLRQHNLQNDRLREMSDEEVDRHVTAQVVELTWLIGHFCLLNKWFTVLQVPDEGPNDEGDFLAAYGQVVPEDIRQRNEEILAGDF